MPYREPPVLKTGSLQCEQDPCNESRFSLWLKQVFPVRMWAQGIPVFITGTGFAVYLDRFPHMSGRKIWINFEAYQRSILRINPWKKYIYLRPFSKYLAEPFLRSKAVRGWILRIWLRKKMLSKKYCCQPRKCKTTLCKLNLYKDMNYFLSLC